MKRVQYNRYGGPEELRLVDVDVPKPERGQLQVRIMAASVNPMDWKIRRGEIRMMTGNKFPRGLGHDFAGVVEAIGLDVEDFAIGDEVFGATSLKQAGTFAEVLVTDAKNTFKKPPNISFEVAGALAIASFTAWHGLMDKAKLRAGQSVFVTGCLGAVGRATVQLALRQGATVTGSCSGNDKTQALQLGVSEVFDYRVFDKELFSKRFDVVFDTAGALSLRQCDSMLKPGGTALHIVITPAKMIRSLISSRHKTVFGTATAMGVAGVTSAAEQGVLVPKIGNTVSLAGMIPAIIALENTGLPKGKLVVLPAL